MTNQIVVISAQIVKPAASTHSRTLNQFTFDLNYELLPVRLYTFFATIF